MTDLSASLHGTEGRRTGVGGARTRGWEQEARGSYIEDSSGSQGHLGTGNCNASSFIGGREGDIPQIATLIGCHTPCTYILSPPVGVSALLHAPAVSCSGPWRGCWVCSLWCSASASGRLSSVELQ